MRGISVAAARALSVGALVCALIAAWASVAEAFPGDLDPSFSGDGLARTDFGLADPLDQANAVVALPGNGVAVAGRANGYSSADIAVARYLPDGELDPSFSGDGRFAQDLSGALRDTIGDLIALEDGALVAAGVIGPPTDENLLIAKLGPAGTLDPTFSPGGSPGFNEEDVAGAPLSLESALAAIRRADGSFVLAGAGNGNQGVPPSDSDLLLARFGANGALDPTFSPGPPGGGDAAGEGIAQLDVSGSTENDTATDLIELPDGRLLATGIALDGGTSEMFVARLSTEGALDTAYGGGDGIASVSVPGAVGSTGYGLVGAPDGGAYAVGFASLTSASAAILLVKLKPDGSLDPAFDGDGILLVDLPSTPLDAASHVELDADGKVVVFGYYGSPVDGFDTAVLRFLANGAADPTFGGGDGIATADFGTATGGAVMAGAIGPDGDLVAAGEAGNDFSVARFEGGTPRCRSRLATMLATGPKTTGTPGDDVIVAAAGAQRVSGDDGNDVICGGADPDRLKGGAGKDRLFGGSDGDRLSGGAGRDRLNGGAGKDRLSGGAGKDRCKSGSGRDRLKGCEKGS